MDYQSPSFPSLLSECVEYTSECAEFSPECVEYTKCMEYTKCAPYSEYAQHVEIAAPTPPFVDYIRKKYYLYEVTFGIYVLDPVEKYTINALVLAVLGLFAFAVAGGLGRMGVLKSTLGVGVDMHVVQLANDSWNETKRRGGSEFGTWGWELMWESDGYGWGAAWAVQEAVCW